MQKGKTPSALLMKGKQIMAKKETKPEKVEQTQDTTNLKLWQICNPFRKPKRFKTPEELWECAMEYFKWADANPIKTNIKTAKYKRQKMAGDELGKNEFTDTVARPYTLTGFFVFAGIHREYSDFKKYYIEQDESYCEVFRAIEIVIQTQQVEGAMSNIYNGNLTARLNGISDKVKAELTGADGKPIENKVVLDDIVKALKS